MESIMEKASGKKLQLILLIMLLIPLSIMSLTFYIYIKVSSAENLNETLYRFNANTAIDSISIPISDINKTLVNMSKILASPEQIQKYISPDSKSVNDKIAAIMNSYSYLKNIIVVNDMDGSYKTYPEHIRYEKDFDPKLRPWYRLNQSGQIYYTDPYITTDQDAIDNKQWHVSSSITIISEDSRMLGVIAADVDLNKISELFRDKIIPYHGQFLITTYDGRVVISPNSREIFRSEIPQEWIEKANKTSGYFYDKDNALVFYKYYSTPNWIAFTSVDEYNQNKYFERSYLLFYTVSTICILILFILFFLYSTYNKQLVGKIYLGANGIDVSSKELTLDGLEREVARQRTKLKLVQHEMVVDNLTQLFNRKKFEEDIAILLSEQSGFCLAMIDLDDFKLINDNFGHLIGDDVLKFVAREGKRILGEENPIYRIGGEEIIILFPKKDLQTSISLLNAWRLQVNERDWKESALKISFSGGITTWESGDYLNDLISRADQALYLAKKSGKNMIISN